MFNRETQATIEALSRGNRQARNVVLELIKYKEELAVLDFTMLRQQNILGADLYELYKCCSRDIPMLHRVIMQNRGPEILKSAKGSSFYVKDVVEHE
jgi:hypothetical protein